MTIRKKSPENLHGQVEDFLEYEEKIGKITEDKSKKILDALGGNDVDILDKEKVKQQLLGVLSSEEFEELYGEYINSYRLSVKKIKEILIKLNLFPDKYQILTNKLINENLLNQSVPFDLDDFIKELNEENFDEMKNQIKSNISVLEEYFPQKKDLLKLDLGIIFYEGDSDKLKSIMSKLKGFGIDSVDDFNKLVKIITDSDTNRILENLETLHNLGINEVDNIKSLSKIICDGDQNNVKILKDLQNLGINISVDELVTDPVYDMLCYGNAEYLKILFPVIRDIKTLGEFVHLYESVKRSDKIKTIGSNIAALKDLGIEKTDKRLKGLIFNGKTKNIEALKPLKDSGVDFKIEDLLDYSDRCEKGRYSDIDIERIKALTILSQDNKSAKAFLSFYDQLLSCDTKKIKENIAALFDMGIKIIDGIQPLCHIIEIGEPEKIKANIETLRGLGVGVEDPSEFFWFTSLIGTGEPEKIKNNVVALNDLGISLSSLYGDEKNDWSYIVMNSKTENLKTLKKLGIINNLKDLNDINDIINNRDTDFLSAICDLGIINSTDDFNTVYIHFNGGQPEIIRAIGNSKIIKSIDDFSGLTGGASYSIEQIVRARGCTDLLCRNIEILSQLHVIKTLEDLAGLEDIIIKGKPDIITALINICNKIDPIKVLMDFKNSIVSGNVEVVKLLEQQGLKVNTDDEYKTFYSIVDGKIENLEKIIDLGIEINSIGGLKKLGAIIKYGDIEIIRELEGLLGKDKINSIDALKGLEKIIRCGNIEIINIFTDNSVFYNDGKTNFNRLFNFTDFICSCNLTNLKILFESFKKFKIIEFEKYKTIFLFQGTLPTSLKFKENDRKGYLKYIKEIINLDTPDGTKSDLISDIVRLPFTEIDGYLEKFKEICINQNVAYSDFIKCFDGKTFNPNLCNFLLKGFEIPGTEVNDNVGILNYSIKKIYPTEDIEFNESETKQILDFINSIGGINKGYTILILTMEKMVRDKVEKKDFNRELCEKLEKYKKFLDMYPEDKIPEGLKVSVGLEFEIILKSLSGFELINSPYTNWFERTIGKNYKEVADDVVSKAKVGVDDGDGITDSSYEFATKPSTNPMVALLEIHLLQELGLLDINDMQKISGNLNDVNCISRNGTGYHLSIGSDSEISVSKNIRFIQNLSSILPRSGISNGQNVTEINRIGDDNIDTKHSSFFVYPNSKGDKYVELRTYSVDDVELFEKNVLFNTYAVMGNQAQKKVSNVTSNKIIELKDNDEIKGPEDLMNYLENNNLFKENQDIKSKKIAVEFMWMQICVLRTISNYNHNFIDDELFGKDLVKNLSESRKNYFLDLLLSDKRGLLGYIATGYPGMVVKNYTNLVETREHGEITAVKFDVQKYIQKNEPFTDKETQEIMKDLWKPSAKTKTKWIPHITTRLNIQLLWAKLCQGVTDTQELQDRINNKISNMDRIKSYLRGNDQNLKIDREYLYNYFREKMSLIQFNPYRAINTDFINKIINLNNFFLKEDDANARGVLENTKCDGKKEENISKKSIFETGYMRKGYNYYQGGSEDMLIHSAQIIALNYMENVKTILNTDYNPEKVNPKLSSQGSVELSEAA